MPKIVIKNMDGAAIKYHDPAQAILKVLHANHIDWMHACGGKGRCTTCSMIIIAGEDELSDPSPAEQKFMDMGRLQANRRLACQTKCTGEVEIAVPDLYKLPHLSYSN